MKFDASGTKKTAMTMRAFFRGGFFGLNGGKGRAISLLATITFEAGTSMMSKVVGVEPFATIQAKVRHAKIPRQFGKDIVMPLVGQRMSCCSA